MELFNKIKNVLVSSTDDSTAKNTTETAETKVVDTTEDNAVEVVKETDKPKDNCCGGNCGG
ncbi:MAG: hypothetical protein KAH22_01950 [Thiotrichaceae bacterium]|nr:hypothetical protein [Thiotrichaceae bacterium]